MEKIYKEKSKISGTGIFANSSIKKGEIIFSVKGKRVRSSYSPYNAEHGHRWLAIKKEIWISPFRNNPWWFINHSCNPNAGLKRIKTVVAMKNIKKGEEVTIDYSITEDDPYWEMQCNCGTPNCRKTIRSVRFLPEKLFNKYKPFIRKFLQKSYFENSSR